MSTQTQTMTERGAYMATFEREYQISLKLMRLYPADQLDLKPGKSPNSARDILWGMVIGQLVVPPILEKTELTDQGLPGAPKTMAEILAAFETAHREATAKLEKFTDAQMNTTLRLPVGPRQVGDVRRGDALWMFLYDGIHHRGQLSVYQRIVGGKVPSIYGPSGDEPWS